MRLFAIAAAAALLFVNFATTPAQAGEQTLTVTQAKDGSITVKQAPARDSTADTLKKIGNEASRVGHQVADEANRDGHKIAREYGRVVDATGRALERNRDTIVGFAKHLTRKRD